MIRVEELSYGVPAKDLYKDISFTIDQGQHCALIGINGTGKSTLVDLIIHSTEYTYDGKIIKDDNCRIGYASQFSISDKEKDITVVEYLSERFLEVQQEIAEVCDEMATAEDMEAVFEKYQALLDLNESMDGDNYESNIHKQLYVAGMLDLKETMISKISGGEYKVLQIVREMLLSPNLLILDEPDAFLDFENLASLSHLINEYKGAMLVVTHNRYLLNHCFNKILHLENCDLQEYDGSYTEYRCAQLRGKLELKRQYLKEQEEIEKTEELVDTLRRRATLMVNPTIGRTVNAKQSQLDRMISRSIEAPVFEMREPVIEFPHIERTDSCDAEVDPSPLLTVEDYSVSFDKCILENVNFEIQPGEKVAIVGANGVGKTTLVHDIIKNDNPAIHINESTVYACLSQVQSEVIDMDKTVNEFMQDKGFGSEGKIRAHLARYGLEDILLRQRVGSLSIGEQNLLQLAALAKSKADLLILDEPTSHLDVYTQTALEQAIQKYQGAVLLISHDFYLIANTADYVLFIEDNTLRRMKAKKFRKMVYERYFDQAYVETDRKRQELEANIAVAFTRGELDAAEKFCDQLEALSTH